jgi:hypothetical protein
MTNRPPSYPKTIKLYVEQQGICWVCGLPMLPPIKRDDNQVPHVFEATLDHLSPKDGQPRGTKAAHRVCNNKRQHEDLDNYRVARFIASMHKRVPRIYYALIEAIAETPGNLMLYDLIKSMNARHREAGVLWRERRWPTKCQDTVNNGGIDARPD